jgi:ATP-binding cassette, subfamily B, multidrug efflux pump
MDSKTKTKVFNLSVLKRILQYAKPYKQKLIVALVLSIVLALLAPVRPMLIQLTVNLGIKNTQGFLVKSVGGFIIEITCIQIALIIVETFCRFVFSFFTAQLGQLVVADLRNTMYKKVLNLNLKQFDTTPIGTLTTRTISDIESINDIFSDGFISIVADVLTIISVLVYMFWVDAKLTLVCLLPFPILLVATYFFKESVNKSFTTVRNAISNLNAFVQEHLTGINPTAMQILKPFLRTLFFFRWWS